jgi:hypothetical protein
MSKLPDIGELVQFNAKIPEIPPYIGKGKYVVVLRISHEAGAIEVGNPLTLELILVHTALLAGIKKRRPQLIHVMYLVGYDNV